MSKDKMMVFGYARVSTENQLENYSIEEQTARLESYCAQTGLPFRPCWRRSGRPMWTL